jgi:hypothetical protein
VSEIESLPQKQLDQFYPFLTHGGRALALWRGKWPCEVQLTSSETEAQP